jgi:hypothetical protein
MKILNHTRSLAAQPHKYTGTDTEDGTERD